MSNDLKLYKNLPKEVQDKEFLAIVKQAKNDLKNFGKTEYEYEIAYKFLKSLKLI